MLAHECPLEMRSCRRSWSQLPTGWWTDLTYTLANNHSFLGIVACDPIHPLSQIERLVIELSTIGFLLYAERLRRHTLGIDASSPSSSSATQDFIILGGMAMTGIVISAVLTFLFTTPGWGQVNEAKTDLSRQQRAKVIQIVGAVVGYALVVLSAFLCYQFLQTSERLAQYLSLAFFSRFEGKCSVD